MDCINEIIDSPRIGYFQIDQNVGLPRRTVLALLQIEVRNVYASTIKTKRMLVRHSDHSNLGRREPHLSNAFAR